MNCDEHIIDTEFFNNIYTGKLNLYTNDISSLEHIVNYSKSKKMNLLDVLLVLYNNFMNEINKLLENNIINNYINFIVNQWNYKLNKLNELFKKVNTNINYNQYIDLNEEYGVIHNNINNFNNYIKTNNYELDGQIKDNIFLLSENIDILIGDLKDYKNELELFNNNILLNYDLLLDISSKNKLDYINHVKNGNEYNKLITNNSNIPDNINIIFLNYLLINNMIKKEINYILYKINLKIDKLLYYKSNFNEVMKDTPTFNNDELGISPWYNSIKQSNQTMN